MTLVRTTDLRAAHEKLNAEVLNIGRKPMGEGAMETALGAGDVFLVDPVDQRADKRGAFAWIAADDWRDPTELFAQQIWGPSTYDDGTDRHLDILIDVCQWGVDHEGEFAFRFADMPITYARDGHLLTVLADQFARVTQSRDGRFSTTTLRTALEGLQEAKGGVDTRTDPGG